jgi:hypothetical protein
MDSGRPIRIGQPSYRTRRGAEGRAMRLAEEEFPRP